MKKLALATTMILAFTLTPQIAKADTICGMIQQRIVKPVCNPGDLCAQYFRVAHMMVNEDVDIELQSASFDVVQQLVQADGSAACVEGEQPPQAKFFEVTTVTPVIGPEGAPEQAPAN